MSRAKEPTVTYVVDKKGKRTAVILPIEKYEELLEDLRDLAIAASRKTEPTYDWEDLKKKLKKDGILSNKV
ncbi:MAG: type II toxin-antitoxin system prevent-host-death family antitoxin [Bacteroidota bacterium]|jgi:prevent-host-death family protein